MANYPGTKRRLAIAATVSLLSVGLSGSSAAAAPQYRGVVAHPLWSDVSFAEMRREVALSRAVGGNVVRVDISWSSLEQRGKRRFSSWYVQKLDAFFASARAHSLKVIATLFTTPCWASSAPQALTRGCQGAWWNRGVTSYPPRDPGDYGDIAGWLTRRYGASLAGLEVWNEPNFPGTRFWNTPDKAGTYARLVRATYARAKAGDRSVPVLVGSLSTADRPFLDALFAGGIAGRYDGISVHLYNEWRDPGDPWQPQWRQYTFLPGLRWLREAQQAVGDAKPLWITEFGWTTAVNTPWQVSEARQAQYVVAAFRLLAALPYVRAATVYNLRDTSTNRADFAGNFGLLRRDFRAKPAYPALRSALAPSAGR